MAQAAYLIEEETVGDAVADPVLAPSICLYGESAELAQVTRDCRACGLAIRSVKPLKAVLAGSAGALGEVLYIEANGIGAAELAALIRIDERAARAGAEVVVATDAASLEDVFGCLDSAQVQFLVDPTAAERLVAIGAAVGRVPGARVRELDEADRAAMLRLSQEVARLAANLDRLALPLRADNSDSGTERLASPGIGFRAEGDDGRVRKLRAPAPDPRLVHRVIRQRRLRDRYFPGGLFSDPAWDILLDLTAARAEHRRVSVTSLCIAAAVPMTTALRWITQLTQSGVLVREQDPQDRRRIFIALSEKTADAMARYFAEMGTDTITPV